MKGAQGDDNTPPEVSGLQNVTEGHPPESTLLILSPFEGGFLKVQAPAGLYKRRNQKEYEQLGLLSDMSSIRKRGMIVLLLVISCALSIYLLYISESTPVYQLESPQKLDSLITESFHEFDISGGQVRTQSIRIDSTFTRKRFTVEVPPSFSKTTFHYKLHEQLLPYKAETIGRVEFPEKNLRVHVQYNQTIHRTIYLYSQSTD
ncbi:MAG: hypothetical protein U5K72_19340 [Balneolaceae bacterium]|nr:hypothetical protein [Balneolaceae bacterium]